jgi:Mn2+/Fe2+ NRAMP family transporter
VFGFVHGVRDYSRRASFRATPLTSAASYGVVVTVRAAVVLVPGLPLIGILFFTQVVNAILLVPLLVVMILIARDREVMGDYRNGGFGQALAYVAAALVGLSLVALVAAA